MNKLKLNNEWSHFVTSRDCCCIMLTILSIVCNDSLTCRGKLYGECNFKQLNVFFVNECILVFLLFLALTSNCALCLCREPVMEKSLFYTKSLWKNCLQTTSYHIACCYRLYKNQDHFGFIFLSHMPLWISMISGVCVQGMWNAHVKGQVTETHRLKVNSHCDTALFISMYDITMVQS